MKLKTEMQRLVTITAPMGTDDDLFHDAACAHALMQAMDEAKAYSDAGDIRTRAAEIMANWGFDSGEET